MKFISGVWYTIVLAVLLAFGAGKMPQARRRERRDLSFPNKPLYPRKTAVFDDSSLT